MTIDDDAKKRIWEKAIIIDKFDPVKYRQDACGAWIRFDDYGNRNSPFGWEVDHICPSSYLELRRIPKDMIDNEINLRPLNWKNNASKGDNYPSYIASVRAVENRNKLIESSFDINVEVQKALKCFYNI